MAILAATANLIVEHGVEVIRTHHLSSGMTSSLASPPPAARETAPPVHGAPDHEAPETASPAASPARNTEMLSAAGLRYQRAVEIRASIEASTAAAELQAAAKNLETVSKTMTDTSMPADRRQAAARLVLAFETAGADTVRLADLRRATLREVAACADLMDGALKASLNGAWKIFGRVLARQSLMQLQTELQDVRQGVAQLRADEGNRATVSELGAAKAAFAATFDANAAGLTRAEGDAWMRGMRENLGKLDVLGESLVKLDIEARDTARQFEKARNRFTQAMPKTIALPADAEKTNVPAGQPSNGVNAPIALPVASPIVDTITTTTTGLGDRERRLVAGITGAVLVLLLAISISTIRSISIPVRRMLLATKKIAGGDVDVRLPGGGIKELNTLSLGFNRMAAELAAARDMARDYQQRLEEKVQHRTRQLQHLAEHDALTNLPNRRQLFVLLNHALERAAQNRRHLAVFFLDVDNFKNLNDSMGHAFGDQVLVGIARRLKETTQTFGFVARLGGDEFTAVYEDAASADVLIEAGGRLVDLFDQPLLIDGRPIMVRASVGASVYPIHGQRAEDLLSAADAALFRAKALGRSQLAVFSPELLETATRKFTIEQGLRRAIEQDELELVYQPEVSLDTLDTVLVEALVRWRLPDGRQALPGEFLTVTEESGLIVEVGNWILRNAIKTASQWHHGEWPEVRVAINVSPRQLMERRFADDVLGLLQEFRLPAHCIELELTESVLQTGPATIESLRHLRSHDIAIALDDFGTGYSSLASLETLPLSRIKLDRSLIASIDSNSRSRAIAAALIGLCQGLDLDITAEGVERPEQFAALANYRGIHLQGYLISRPVSRKDLIATKLMTHRIMQDLLLGLPAGRPRMQSAGPGAPSSLASGSVER